MIRKPIISCCVFLLYVENFIFLSCYIIITTSSVLVSCALVSLLRVLLNICKWSLYTALHPCSEFCRSSLTCTHLLHQLFTSTLYSSYTFDICHSVPQSGYHCSLYTFAIEYLSICSVFYLCAMFWLQYPLSTLCFSSEIKLVKNSTTLRHLMYITIFVYLLEPIVYYYYFNLKCY